MGKIIVSVLYTFVNYLLLTCTGRLLNSFGGQRRIFAGSFLSGLFVLVCQFSSIQIKWPIYLLVVLASGIISFGFSSGWIVRVSVYVMLNLSLGGIDVGVKGILSMSIGSAGILMIILIRHFNADQEFVPVLIDNMGDFIKITALLDTGNRLKDPVTGRPVLLVGADIAQRITGLSILQLKNPVDNVGLIQGMRLISYNTISERGHFLLAKKMNNIQIGDWKGSILVAFCPELLAINGKYQALIGGHL